MGIKGPIDEVTNIYACNDVLKRTKIKSKIYFRDSSILDYWIVISKVVSSI